ncbi:MAG: hypothetical protein KDD99_20455, partial [Bacteroidetes bacterium]|nr:hypothetical protein [Bacteroidota bacterium]
MALLDSWASILDILTFYQERLANESYLNTATERFSLVELGRLIGYEPHPGLASDTHLAFTLDENSLLPGQMMAMGRHVGKVEHPIITLEAGLQVQSIPDKDQKPQVFETTETIQACAVWNAMKLALRPVSPNQKLSSSKTIWVTGIDNNLTKGNKLLIRIKNGKEYVRKIEDISVEKDFDSTSINLVNPFILSNNGSGSSNNEEIESIKVFRKQAAFFGYNSSKYEQIPTDVQSSTDEPKSETKLVWKVRESVEQDSLVYLDNVYQEILPNSDILIQEVGKSLEYTLHFSIKSVNHTVRSAYGINAKVTQLTLSGDVGFWPRSLDYIRNCAVYIQSDLLELAAIPYGKILNNKKVLELEYALDENFKKFKEGQKIILSGKPFSLKRIEDLSSNISKECSGSEVLTVKRIQTFRGRTNLYLDSSPKCYYIRKTVTINANVAKATHGESTKEVLGSGDASKKFQKFTLSQTPLTYIPHTGSSTGRKSTLEIRVNNVLWKEVPNFYQQSADALVYIVRQNDQGQSTVIFGDGINGSRLPTGQFNITASYRMGLGVEGKLKRDQLSQLI